MSADIGLTAAGDFPLYPTLISGAPLIAQRIKRRLQRYLGEELLNRALGLPYFAWRSVKPPPVAEIAAFVRREIESVPGVVGINDYAVSYTTGRLVTITGTVLTADDDEIGLTVVPITSDGSGNASVLLRMPDFATI